MLWSLLEEGCSVFGMALGKNVSVLTVFCLVCFCLHALHESDVAKIVQTGEKLTLDTKVSKTCCCIDQVNSSFHTVRHGMNELFAAV